MKQIKKIAVLALCITLLAGCGTTHKPVETTEDPLATYVPETIVEPTVIPATINPEDNVTRMKLQTVLSLRIFPPTRVLLWNVSRKISAGQKEFTH